MSAPVPVLLMVRELGPGGTERQLTELARTLDRTRFEPHVACFHEGIRSAELRVESIPILRLPIRSYLSLGAWTGALQLGRYLRTNRIQLVHTFDYPLNCFGVPAARFFRTPVVLSSQRADRRLNPRFYQHALRVTDRMVDAVVVNCEGMQRHLLKDEHVPMERIRLCYNGLDTEQFHEAPRARPADLAGASLVVGAVCVLRPEKSVATLLDAFAHLASRCTGLRLVIVGSGPELAGLQARARALNITDACHFAPATADVPGWLHAIDIFVLPSLSEALSNSLMEAMACGCAVIASDTGGNPELVADRETGLLFQPGDAVDLAAKLEILIEQDKFRGQLARAGAALMRDKFSLPVMARQMEAIYDEFLGKAPYKR